MTPRTPEERERMRGLMWRALYPSLGRWAAGGRDWNREREYLDRLLAAFPQLWDSLPPDPAETARKEAEEDGEGPQVVNIREPGSGWYIVCAEWPNGQWRVLRTHSDGPAEEVYASGFGWQSVAVCAALNEAKLGSPRAAAGYPVLIAPKGDDRA